MEALFRDGLLAGQVIVAAGPCGGVPARLEALGATVLRLALTEDEDEAGREAQSLIAGAPSRVGTLVVDGAAAGELPQGLDRVWIAIRAVATAALIPEERGGKVVILAPGPHEGEHPEAARTALENVSRTLSVEWARFGVRLTTIAPGAGTPADVVPGLVAYLASPAGDYFSGSRLSLA